MNTKGTYIMDRKARRHSLLALLMFSISIFLFVGCEDNVTQPPPPPPGPGPRLLVANDGGGTGYLSTVDLDSTGEVRQGVAGLGRVPNYIVREGDKIYVLNTNSQDINILQLGNSSELTSIDTVDVSFGGNRSPNSMALANTGDFYISNFADNSVSILDKDDLTISLIIPNVGQAPCGVLAYDDKIYVANSGYRNGSYDSVGVVAVISTVSTRVINRINVGVNPQYMIKDSNGQIHVVCTGDYNNIPGVIYKISARADTITQVINIGGSPGDIALSGAFAYLSSFGNGTDGYLYRYNISTGQVLNSQANPILVGAGASRIVSRSNGSVFVSCWSADKVEEIVGTGKMGSWSTGDGPGPLIVLED